MTHDPNAGHKDAADIASLVATFYNTFRDQAIGPTVNNDATYLAGKYLETLIAVMVGKMSTPAPAANDVLMRFVNEAIERANHKR